MLRRLSLIIACTLCVGARDRCAASDGDRAALEEGLFADAQDGKLDQHSLGTALLIASGVKDKARLDRNRAMLAQWREELGESGAVRGTPLCKAQAIHEFMHRRILRGKYRQHSSGLDEPIEVGDFNCLSSAALFVLLAGQFDLEVAAVCSSTHVWCQTPCPEPFVVETTCPAWFRLNQSERTSLSTALSHAVERNESGSPRTLRTAQLVAAVYFNRAAALLEQRRFSESLAANVAALRLDPGSLPARRNALASLNAWALSLAEQQNYVAALEVLREGQLFAPEFGPFRTNDAFVRRAWSKSH